MIVTPHYPEKSHKNSANCHQTVIDNSCNCHTQSPFPVVNLKVRIDKATSIWRYDMATTWGSMMSAPGNIASGVIGGVGKAIKYTIYGAVICGLAVGLNQFASNAFGVDNWAAKGADWLGDNVGPYVMKVFNWLTSWLGVTPASESTIGTFIGGTARTVGAAGFLGPALDSAGAIGTIQGWANSIGSSVGGWIGPYPLSGGPGNIEANTRIANGVLAAGGTALATGVVAGKWQAAEEQRRAARAQAMQQLG
ncbi:MAG: hypothetical protein ACOYNL_11010 [Rickettsiales bacterium]